MWATSVPPSSATPLSRVARFVGHKVITDNHIGDWGTQFGMILWGWKNILDEQALEANPIDELLRVYKDVNLMCKEKPELLDTCKAELVKLQAGDRRKPRHLEALRGRSPNPVFPGFTTSLTSTLTTGWGKLLQRRPGSAGGRHDRRRNGPGKRRSHLRIFRRLRSAE